MSYKISKISPTELAKNLGVNYNTFVNYRVTDPTYQERVDFVENYLYGGKGEEERQYLKAKLTGRPLLNKYLILTNDDESISCLLESIFINVNRTKNYKKTQIQGLDGLVNEYINDGDYIINMSGALIGADAWNYDDEEIKNFVDIVNLKSSVKVNNSYLRDYFGITNIIIDNWELNQSTDYSNVVYYKIDCSSDFPTNLITEK